MAFYNDSWTIANIDPREIFLIRKSANDILLDRIKKDTNIAKKETIAQNILEEYAVGIGIKNELYIIYQNKAMDLFITVLSENKKEDIKLTAEPIPKVIDLNIIVRNTSIHIVYLIKIQDEENKFRIYHHHYDGNDWDTNIVKEIIAKRVLNPMKLIQEENNLVLGYYVNDLEIELKRFDFEDLQWSDSFKLVTSSEEKLYIDMISYNNKIHLVYCEFQEGNLIIRYEQFSYLNNIYERKLEKVISNEGSLFHPTIIIYENKIWITWVELDKVMSRVGSEDGKDWSDSIYSWDNSRSIDFIRYKYLTFNLEKDRTLDYSFGSVFPEIEFIGFGNLGEATEIPIKKALMNLPRI